MPKPWEKYQQKPWERYAQKQPTQTPTDFNAQTQDPAHPFGWSPNIQKPAILENPSLGQGIQQAQQGNIVGGAGNISAGLIQGAISPLSTADQTLRQVPYVGKPISNLLNSPINLYKNLAQGVQSGLDYIGVPKDVQNLGMKPETAQGLNNLLSTVAPIVTAPMTSQIMGKTGQTALQKTGEAINTRRITKATQEIKKSAPPTSKELNYDASLKRAEPYIAEQQRLNPVNPKTDISPMRQATDLVAEAKSKLWNEKVTQQIARHADETISGDVIASQVREGLTDYVKNHEPLLADRIESYAKTFEGKQLTLKQANDYIKEINAKTRSYQKAPDVMKAQMETADPNIAAKVDAVNTLRNEVYNKLESFGEMDVRELRKDYGALADIHKALERKIVSSERQGTSNSFYMKPFGTAVAGAATIEGLAHAPLTTLSAGGMGLIRRLLIDRNKPNPTINRAFGRLGKSDLTPRQIFPPMEEPNMSGNIQSEIKYNGIQQVPGGGSVPMYTDTKTGSTFVKMPTETLEQALARVRKRFGQ